MLVVAAVCTRDKAFLEDYIFLSGVHRNTHTLYLKRYILAKFLSAVWCEPVDLPTYLLRQRKLIEEYDG